MKDKFTGLITRKRIIIFIGALIATSPFTVISIFMVIQGGWESFFIVWGGVLSIVFVVVGGLHIMQKAMEKS